MSNEEHNREPDPQEPEENGDAGAEPVEEAQGTPADPGTVDEAEIVEEPEDHRVDDDLVEEESGVAEEDLAAVAAELDQTRRERDEYLESLRRLKAEFENSRKRQERELTQIRERASENLVTELLPVLDNLDRALDSEGDIRGGVQATREQLAEILEREGLSLVASDGQHFDPNVHEAVMGQPTEEHEEGTILQTFERGYVLNGKSIRPAKVVVAREV
ncbi:nucleotide exchange factor GrpE [soil metagenome]